MNRECKVLKDMLTRLQNGEDPEQVIPYDLTGFEPDIALEIMLLYQKYGNNLERLKVINKCMQGKKSK